MVKYRGEGKNEIKFSSQVPEQEKNAINWSVSRVPTIMCSFLSRESRAKLRTCAGGCITTADSWILGFVHVFPFVFSFPYAQLKMWVLQHAAMSCLLAPFPLTVRPSRVWISSFIGFRQAFPTTFIYFFLLRVKFWKSVHFRLYASKSSIPEQFVVCKGLIHVHFVKRHVKNESTHIDREFNILYYSINKSHYHTKIMKIIGKSSQQSRNEKTLNLGQILPCRMQIFMNIKWNFKSIENTFF